MTNVNLCFVSFCCVFLRQFSLMVVVFWLFSDERQDVQKKTFTKWINGYLSKTNSPPIRDLFTDLRDGNRLLALLEVLTNKKYVSNPFFILNVND